MPDWSRIGRCSRQKGNSFERKVAALFTKSSGIKFCRCPSSGGAHWPGDVILVDQTKRLRVVFECKNVRLPVLKALKRCKSWAEHSIRNTGIPPDKVILIFSTCKAGDWVVAIPEVLAIWLSGEICLPPPLILWHGYYVIHIEYFIDRYLDKCITNNYEKCWTH